MFLRSLSLSILSGGSFLLAACSSFSPYDPDQGFVVADRDKFRHELRVCEEDVTRLGYPDNRSMADATSRNSRIRRCLIEKGWAEKSEINKQAPTPPPPGQP